MVFNKWFSLLQTININHVNTISHRLCEKHFKSSDIIGNCMTMVGLYLYNFNLLDK